MTKIDITADSTFIVRRPAPVNRAAFIAGFRGEECPIGGDLEDYGHGVTMARTVLRRASISLIEASAAEQ